MFFKKKGYFRRPSTNLVTGDDEPPDLCPEDSDDDGDLTDHSRSTTPPPKPMYSQSSLSSNRVRLSVFLLMKHSSQCFPLMMMTTLPPPMTTLTSILVNLILFLAPLLPTPHRH